MIFNIFFLPFLCLEELAQKFEFAFHWEVRRKLAEWSIPAHPVQVSSFAHKGFRTKCQFPPENYGLFNYDIFPSLDYLSSEEKQNVAWWFGQMDLHDSYVRSIQIIRFWLFGV